MATFDKFIHSINLVLSQNQILGTAPFTVSQRNFLKSKPRCLVNIIIILLFLGYIIFYLYQIINLKDTSTMYKSTEVILIFAGSAYVTVSWIHGLFNSEKYSQILKEIITLDQSLQTLGEIPYENQRKKDLYEMIVRYITTFFIVIYYLTVRVYKYERDIHLEVIRGILLLIKSATCHLVIQLVFIIEKRFLILNEHLKKLLAANFTAKQQLVTLRQVCEKHHSLTKIVNKFNETFGILLLVFFATSFVIIVISFFYFSANLQLEHFNWDFCIAGFMWSVPFVADVIYICNVCYKAVEEAKLTGELIHKIETEDSDVIDEIEMFSLQIANGQIEFSAAGFFPVDHTLVFSIIGGVTTYIIILVQLSASLVAY